MNLKREYYDLLSQFGSEPFLGIIIDDSPHLWGLVCLASQLHDVEQVGDMVLGTLASNWTFNAEGPELPTFPDGYGNEEVQRWELAFGKAPYRLSNLLANRIGTCATYSIVLAIYLRLTKKAETVRLFWKPPHVWVQTENPDFGVIDLAERSHGYRITERPDHDAKAYVL